MLFPFMAQHFSTTEARADCRRASSFVFKIRLKKEIIIIMHGKYEYCFGILIFNFKIINSLPQICQYE